MNLLNRLTPGVLIEKPSAPSSRQASKTRLSEEVAAILPILSSALAGGMPIAAALKEAAEPARGELGLSLREALGQVEAGMSLQEALSEVALKLKHPAVSELASKIQFAIRFGSPMVPQLRQLAQTLDQELEQKLLRHSAKAETRMLIPLVFLILPISVLFALYPSLSLLQNINY